MTGGSAGDFLWLQAFKNPLKVFPLTDIEGSLFLLLYEHAVIFLFPPPHTGLSNYSMFLMPGRMGQEGRAVFPCVLHLPLLWPKLLKP